MLRATHACALTVTWWVDPCLNGPVHLIAASDPAQIDLTYPTHVPSDSEMCLFNVDGGQRAVIFDRFQGVKGKVVGEGTHFMIPLIQRPIIIDVRARPRTINSVTGTKDLQMANISLRVLSRPLEPQLPRIYQELGTDFDDRVLPSLGNEVRLKGGMDLLHLSARSRLRALGRMYPQGHFLKFTTQHGRNPNLITAI